MGRQAKGSIYLSAGSYYLALTLGRRISIRLPSCDNEADAEIRRAVIVSIGEKLKRAGRLDLAETICRRAAEADPETLGGILKLVDGLMNGTERPLPQLVSPTSGSLASMTVREFAEGLWTNNELARRHRGRVKPIEHSENLRKLKSHVFPVVYKGRRIADTPLKEFTLDHGDCVLMQPTLSERSVRHVAQVMHRLFQLAVYPARLIERSPFPRGWLPAANSPKQRSYLFPKDDAALMACAKVPLVRRLFFGFCAREGVRRKNAVTLEWTNLTLDLPHGGGHIVLERTKNGRGGSWKLDPGTTEALRRWQKLCPSDRYVFPACALPRHRRERAQLPLSVDHAAQDLRDALTKAGVGRAKLFENSDTRQRHGR